MLGMLAVKGTILLLGNLVCLGFLVAKRRVIDARAFLALQVNCIGHDVVNPLS
jgi:hypothetical protein